MVGTSTAANSREKLAGLVDSAKSASDIQSKLHRLHRLKRDLSLEDSASLAALIPRLLDLHRDTFSPVRKFSAELVGEIGLRHVELLPEIVPGLMTVLNDVTPAVVRQAISCGTDLFGRTLEKIAIQGLYCSELNSSLVSSWEWMLRFKEKIYSIAFQPGSGGIRLLALKFVVSVILLYTPDPSGSLEPPSSEENLVEFNVSWLRGGHPVLNVGDLSIEAGKNLDLLLDQLRSPAGNSLSNSAVIVLIYSLSAVAKKRPAFYGRILPVLLGLNPSPSIINGIQISGSRYALKTAFVTCLSCTHPSASPWRDRLMGALRNINVGGSAQTILLHVPKITGGERDELSNSSIVKEEANSNLGKKRTGSQDKGGFVKDEDTPGKRLRATPSASEDSVKEPDKNISATQDEISSSSSGPSISKGDGDPGPVHQLVAMFGDLVAQGEKAVGYLEILISSISADLLAELVMVNMRNLPPDVPMVEGDDDSLLNVNMFGSDSKAKYPLSFVANVLSLSTTFPKIALQLDTRTSVSYDSLKHKGEVEQVEDNAVGSVETPLLTTGLSTSDVSSEMGRGSLTTPSDIHDTVNLESEIPGLVSSVRKDEMSGQLAVSALISADLDNSKDQVASLGERSSINLPASVSTEMSEELSPKAPASEENSIVSSSATSVGLAHHFVLPRLLAPVINLADDEKDELQKSAFNRVIEAYKHISVSGGSQLRSSLLAHLAVEFPLELDPWKLMQKHILEDYVNHEGHELSLRVLYRLFGEAEDRDFFSSTTATSVYEMFLLTVLETIRDSFPPSDKSLGRLLVEVPYLPNKVLKLLDDMCSPENLSDKTEKELQNGDRVTQGLTTVWSLILLRPPFRESCLKIALKSAVHHVEEVRMKAIRLVANKLYPMPSVAQRIEEFAKETLLSIINSDAPEKLDGEGPISELQKDSDPEKQLNETQSTGLSSSDTVSDAQRCMSLYFALCTKKHSLFREVFVIYKSASRAVEQAVERHIPILVRTMGSSPDLLDIISDPPVGSEGLLIQVLHTLTDGTVPSQELISAIKKLHDSKLKNMEILVPILPFLSRDEVLLNFPQIVNLPMDKFQAALARILQGSPHSGPLLAPAEVLIAIHGIDHEREKIPLKKVTDVCNACFEQRNIFTQQVLAKVLNQLVEQIPLPVLFMRTVLQAIGAFPGLVDFAVEILSRLVNKQIWKYPKLWVGFLKCALLTQSFSVLLQLPPAQLENALHRTPALKAPLVTHASQPEIRSSLPRSILTVLGIALDSQTSPQPQTSSAQAGETTTASEIEVTAEKSKESSDAS